MKLPPVYKVVWEDAITDWVDGTPDLKPLLRTSVGFMLPTSNGAVMLSECVDEEVTKAKKVMAYVQCIPRSMIKSMRRMH
jgi:hypothetical protein